MDGPGTAPGRRRGAGEPNPVRQVVEGVRRAPAHHLGGRGSPARGVLARSSKERIGGRVPIGNENVPLSSTEKVPLRSRADRRDGGLMEWSARRGGGGERRGRRCPGGGPEHRRRASGSGGTGGFGRRLGRPTEETRPLRPSANRRGRTPHLGAPVARREMSFARSSDDRVGGRVRHPVGAGRPASRTRFAVSSQDRVVGRVRHPVGAGRPASRIPFARSSAERAGAVRAAPAAPKRRRTESRSPGRRRGAYGPGTAAVQRPSPARRLRFLRSSREPSASDATPVRPARQPSRSRPGHCSSDSATA